MSQLHHLSLNESLIYCYSSWHFQVAWADSWTDKSEQCIDDDVEKFTWYCLQMRNYILNCFFNFYKIFQNNFGLECIFSLIYPRVFSCRTCATSAFKSAYFKRSRILLLHIQCLVL